VHDDGVYALLTDGTTVLIRPARPQDADAVRQMHAQMSPDNVYLRFFSISPLAAGREARRVTRPPSPDHCALLAWLSDELVGVGSYEPSGKPGIAEIAFAVTDHMHGRGVATLLLDHLVSAARLRGLRAFTASTLAANIAMLRVFASAGLAARRQFADGVIQTTFPLPADEADQQLQSYLDTVAMRERMADVASLRSLLQPSSVVVVGASRRPGRVGHAILRNIVSGGFAGRIYAVNPHATSIAGVTAVPSVADLPEPPDVAVVAVPPAGVAGVARECGDRGVRALVVVTSGLDSADGSELLAICRRHGMRLVGPNCFGIAIPSLGLNATFAGAVPTPGAAGLVVQSGGIGIAVLEHLSRLGIGVSSFASVGDKYDVSSNDMLTWWEQDGATRIGVLYVESFGSPRRFAHTARRVGRQFPVLTVIGGRSAAGQRAAASHTAAAATRLITQEALFGQAGVVATTSLGELVDAAALLATQPLPSGSRVAIISNAGGAGVLAADACVDNDLRVAVLSEHAQELLRQLLPAGAAVANPVDTTAAVTRRTFRSALEQVAADDGVDAVMVITVPTALGHLEPAIRNAVLSKTVVAVMLDQRESVRLLGKAIPAYLFPENAARALGHAVRYSGWRSGNPGQVPELDGLSPDEARQIVSTFLRARHLGGWLPPDQAASLLACYGITLSAAKPPGGTEVTIGVVHEPVFGPLVVFGLGGIATDVLEDHAARLSPLTDVDAGELIRGIRAAPLLLGRDGSPPADLAALADMLLRVSRLADEVPEVAELELSPVIAAPGGITALDAQIRLVPAEPADPFLRRLR
jgi:acyl-CoA synthetase (NDP forming)/GNAT superfamily N-acetyltransferase